MKPTLCTKNYKNRIGKHISIIVNSCACCGGVNMRQRTKTVYVWP